MTTVADRAAPQQDLALIRRGTRLLAIAMTEPGAGSDLQGIRTTAVRDPAFPGAATSTRSAKEIIARGLGL
jgi:hypothetical protein